MGAVKRDRAWLVSGICSVLTVISCGNPVSSLAEPSPSPEPLSKSPSRPTVPTTASGRTSRNVLTPTQATRDGGAVKRVKFELPTRDSDYRQKDQWVEKLIDNCGEAVGQRTKCVQLKFTFFAQDGQRRRSIGDPGSNYDSDEFSDCTVTKMSPEGERGKLVPVGSTVSIEVVCTRAEVEQPDGEDESPPAPN